MSDIDTRDLTASEARRLTDRIKSDLSGLLPMIRDAFERRAWLVLGYEDWYAYCDAELKGLRLPVGDRGDAAAELYAAGMSQRAIGSALGVHHSTVAEDLRSRGGNPPRDAVTGADGKTYPATKPPKGVANTDTPADDPVTTDQPADPPAEAAPTAPSAPSPTEQFLAADPELQLRNYAVKFSEALSKSGSITTFDAERVAEAIGPETFLALEVTAAAVNRFYEAVRKARFGGPRLVKTGESA